MCNPAAALEPTLSRKVAIVGAAPSSKDLAPFKDEAWEIWACSPSSRDLPRITAWFELHDVHFLKQEKHQKWAGPYREWLRAAKFRVVMQCANDIAPQAEVYPWDAVRALCPHGGLMLTSSIAEMIAYAVLAGDVGEIGIWGVDMASDSEWAYELPGCQVWMARARERGIRVSVPSESSLDRQIPVYGLDDATDDARKLREHTAELIARRQGVVNRLNQIDAEKPQLLREHYYLDGAIDQTLWMRKTFVSWSGPDL